MNSMGASAEKAAVRICRRTNRKLVQVGLQLEPEDVQRLVEISQATGRSRGYVVGEAIRHLHKLIPDKYLKKNAAI